MSLNSIKGKLETKFSRVGNKWITITDIVDTGTKPKFEFEGESWEFKMSNKKKITRTLKRNI